MLPQREAPLSHSLLPSCPFSLYERMKSFLPAIADGFCTPSATPPQPQQPLAQLYFVAHSIVACRRMGRSSHAILPMLPINIESACTGVRQGISISLYSMCRCMGQSTFLLQITSLCKTPFPHLAISLCCIKYSCNPNRLFWSVLVWSSVFNSVELSTVPFPSLLDVLCNNCRTGVIK